MNKYDAVYARYSSHKQDESTSIEVQLNACHDKAEGGWVDYVDRAKTGRSVAGRPELLRLLADSDAGKIKRVLVYKFDRLGRTAEIHGLVQDLEDLNIEVVSATEGKDALSRDIQIVVSAEYVRALSGRTRDGLLKRFDERRWTGGSPSYGFQVISRGKERVLAIAPNEAECIRWLVATYLSECVGFKELARRLRERGTPTRRGAPWNFTSVRGILTNPMLTGRVRYNRRRMKLNRKTGRRVPLMKDRSEHQEYQDEELRIISSDEFGRVQAQLGKRSQRRTPGSSRSISPFSGHLICGSCGRVFYRRISKNAKGEYAYYSCSTRQRLGPGECPCTTFIREDILMEELAQVVHRIFNDAESIIDEAISKARDRVDSNRAEAIRLRREIAEMDRYCDGLTRLLLDPVIEDGAKTVISRQLRDAGAKREPVQARLDGMIEKAEENTESLADAVRRGFAEAKAGFEGVSTPVQINRWVEEWVSPLRVDVDGVVTTVSPEMAKASDESEAFATSNIAGVGFEPTTSGL